MLWNAAISLNFSTGVANLGGFLRLLHQPLHHLLATQQTVAIDTQEKSISFILPIIATFHIDDVFGSEGGWISTPSSSMCAKLMYVECWMPYRDLVLDGLQDLHGAKQVPHLLLHTPPQHQITWSQGTMIRPHFRGAGEGQGRREAHRAFCFHEACPVS
jgi:hypothetical protein